MPIVQSLGTLEALGVEWRPYAPHGSVRMYDQYAYDYATMYRTQPNVRTCVDFLARNIAQLGLHVFRRVSETDRQRLRDHPLTLLLGRPMPPEYKVTRYRLIESLLADMGVYFNAYWLKVRVPGEAPMGLMRIPPAYVTVYGGLWPQQYEINYGGTPRRVGPSEIVHFRGYSADSPTVGLSPLETLRRVLAEEHSMGAYRQGFWQNAARMHGIIERPADAVEWSDTARARFKAEFEALYAGEANSGKTAILEEGMTWKAATFNAQESEYLAGRKLTREECARAYHIPLPMVGILDHATFANIREQHKNLYQDSLGPWLAMIEQEIELQLMPDFDDTQGVYVEFNIAEKLQGSFEEQTAALQAAVGVPWMTADEARARANLPSMGGDAGKLVTPLNVLVGGQASPQDSALDGALGLPAPATKARRGKIDPTQPRLRARHEEQWRRVMVRTFERQRGAVMGHMKAAGADINAIWDADRWNRELYADIRPMSDATAKVWARYLAQQLDLELDEEAMDPWLAENSRIAAERINGATQQAIGAALDAEDAITALGEMFALAIAVRATEIATSRVTVCSNFGSQEAARQGGLRSKTWQVNSTNPRSEHAAMDGETVGIGELFSNGMRWPGDPAGGAENTANCQCSCVFGTE